MAAQLERLDLATVTSFSHVIARETVLEGLLTAVMRTTVKASGAGRGLLMLSQGAGHRIVAEAAASREVNI